MCNSIIRLLFPGNIFISFSKIGFTSLVDIKYCTSNHDRSPMTSTFWEWIPDQSYLIKIAILFWWINVWINITTKNLEIFYLKKAFPIDASILLKRCFQRKRQIGFQIHKCSLFSISFFIYIYKQNTCHIFYSYNWLNLRFDQLDGHYT